LQGFGKARPPSRNARGCNGECSTAGSLCPAPRRLRERQRRPSQGTFVSAPRLPQGRRGRQPGVGRLGRLGRRGPSRGEHLPGPRRVRLVAAPHHEHPHGRWVDGVGPVRRDLRRGTGLLPAGGNCRPAKPDGRIGGRAPGPRSGGPACRGPCHGRDGRRGGLGRRRRRRRRGHRGADRSRSRGCGVRVPRLRLGRAAAQGRPFAPRGRGRARARGLRGPTRGVLGPRWRRV